MMAAQSSISFLYENIAVAVLVFVVGMDESIW
jgi:hypothetical protein